MGEQDATRLRQLEAERARLEAALGYADADAIIAMVQSLQEQLTDLYAGMDRSDGRFPVHGGQP